MSTPTVAPPPRLTGTVDGAVRRVPLGRLVRVETRKTVDTRSGTWALVAIAVVTIGLLTVNIATGDPDDLTFRDFARSTSLTLLLPVLAILVITTEWTQRTALTTFTLEPQRVRVVLAKLLAVTVIALLALAFALVAAAVGNVAASALADGSGAWRFGAGDVRDLVLLQLLSMLQAFAFGLLLMNTTAAIFVYYVVVPLVSSAFALVRPLEDLAPWLELGTATAPIGTGTVTAETWAHVAVAGSLWVLLPLGLGVVRLLRREIKAG